MMTTPVTARNGEEVTKSGIGLGSFIGGHWRGRYDEVGAGHRDDLHLLACGDLRVCGGGHVVRGSGEADHHGSESVGRNPDITSPARADQVLEAEAGARLGRA